MPQLFSRAPACARALPTLSQQLSRLRIAPAPIQQSASVSYKPNPQAPRKPNPNAASKIPQSARPLRREATPPPTLSEEALASMPYIVRRTAFAQLPVYRKWMSGGTRQVVLVKKLTGNRDTLLKELMGKLDIPQEKARINPTTGHLELKGDYLDKTRQYLLDRGF